jgi:hypothetical protein
MVVILALIGLVEAFRLLGSLKIYSTNPLITFPLAFIIGAIT